MTGCSGRPLWIVSSKEDNWGDSCITKTRPNTPNSPFRITLMELIRPMSGKPNYITQPICVWLACRSTWKSAMWIERFFSFRVPCFLSGSGKPSLHWLPWESGNCMVTCATLLWVGRVVSLGFTKRNKRYTVSLIVLTARDWSNIQVNDWMLLLSFFQNHARTP